VEDGGRDEDGDEEDDHRAPERPGGGESEGVEEREEEGVRDGHGDGEDEAGRLIAGGDAVLEEPPRANEHFDPRTGEATGAAVTPATGILDPRRHGRVWGGGRQGVSDPSRPPPR
jgi:hypothetical protein